MPELVITEDVIAAIRSGDEVLDRGIRGAAIELDLLRGAGLLSAPLPVNLGGRGWGICSAGALPMFEILSALGGASLPVARIYEGHVNALKLVATFGTDAQRANIAERVHDGAVLGVWGADGPAPVSITDTADGPQLIGWKAFASGLGDVGLAVITAKVDDGLQMVIADVRDPVRATQGDWDVAAMVGSRSGSFDCHGLPAKGDVLLGPSDTLFAEPDFHGGLWRLTACYAGALARIATVVSQTLEQRKPPIPPLMEQRVGQLAIEAESAALWARHACIAVETDHCSPDAAVQTALFARQAIESSTERALAIAERAIGTAFHRRDSELGRRARDLRFYLRQADLDGKLSLATRLWMSTRSEDEPT